MTLRTIPPAAAPIRIKDLINGVIGMASPESNVKALEDDFKTAFGVRHAFAVSSGKAALTLILEALKSISEKRNEVVIPAYTCFSVPSAIVKAGLDVVPCDVDPRTLDFDYAQLEKAVGEKTLCVIPNHLFGVPSDMDSVERACGKKGAFIVEDAAQAMGALYRGRMLGTIGDAGFFSFGRGKNVTCGSGGIIITGSDRIASAVRKRCQAIKQPSMIKTLAEFFKAALTGAFIHPRLYWLPSSLPFLGLGKTIFYRDFPVERLSGMKAGMLREWKKRLHEGNRARSSNSGYYGVKLGKGTLNGVLPYLRFPLMAGSREERDGIYRKSSEKGLGVSLMYPTAVSEIEEIREKFAGRDYPGARTVAERLIALPTHGLVRRSDMDSIVRLIRKEN